MQTSKGGGDEGFAAQTAPDSKETFAPWLMTSLAWHT